MKRGEIWHVDLEPVRGHEQNGRRYVMDVGVIAFKQSLQAYDQLGFGAHGGISRKVAMHWTLRAGITAQSEAVTQNGARRDYHFVGLPVTAAYDSTGNPLDPAHGARATVSITPVESFGTPGGTYFLTQASASTYFDFRTEGRSVLALRGLIGQASGVGVFGMPPDQRFYGGGNATVRGYRFQSIGPQFAPRRPEGGTAVSAGSVEMRQRFLTHWGVAAFLDAGQVSGSGNPFGRGWQAGAGLGGRYYTSFGPIRLDVAVPLSRTAGADAFEVYIGLGQAF